MVIRIWGLAWARMIWSRPWTSWAEKAIRRPWAPVTVTRPDGRPKVIPRERPSDIALSCAARRPAVITSPSIGRPLATPLSDVWDTPGAPPTLHVKNEARSERFASTAATPTDQEPIRFGLPVIRPLVLEIDSPGGRWLE